MTGLAGLFTYWLTIFIAIAGLYIVIARGNLVKKLVGLSIFQTSVYLLYIAPGKLIGGTAPIVSEGIYRLLQSAAARAHPHRDRRGRRDARAGSRARRAHTRGLRHHRRRRDTRAGRDARFRHRTTRPVNDIAFRHPAGGPAAGGCAGDDPRAARRAGVADRGRRLRRGALRSRDGCSCRRAAVK